MSRTRSPYPPEFREQIVNLHRSGRTIASLAQDFEPTEQTIRNWVNDSKRGKDEAALSDDERDELRRLRQEVTTLKMEREILEKAAAWFAQKTVPKSSSGS
jgi:transposase